MALASVIESAIAFANMERLADASIIFSLIFLLYSVYLHPLSHIPGSFTAKITPISLWLLTYRGIEASTLTAEHEKRGPVIRIAPNEVSVSDGAALAPIYISKGGYKKSENYTNFYIEGHATLFSALDMDYRAVRAKVVLPMFSTTSIRKDGWASLSAAASQWADVIETAKHQSRRINILSSARALALDSVCSYLFGRTYGGLNEILAHPEGHFSADAFVNTFVAFGRFFYLPGPIFRIAEKFAERADFTPEVLHSIEKVDGYADSIVADAQKAEGENTYQARLLRAGISAHETAAQCKDLIFAGTDSTGMNLATIVFHLVRNPPAYSKLRAELLAQPDADPMALPYLTAVVKEGLRVSMANPTRLPRVVPAGGVRLPSGHFLPAGTIAGIGAHSLHMNARVFSEPEKFLPERWLNASAEMARDNIPFGMGSRACVARNLATVELHLGIEAVVRKGVLEGARCVDEKVRIWEWFNSRVVGERIEIVWD